MLRTLLLLIIVAVTSCAGESSDPGTRARIDVDGAQFAPGHMPVPTGGPAVVTLNNQHSVVAPGSRGERVTTTSAAVEVIDV